MTKELPRFRFTIPGQFFYILQSGIPASTPYIFFRCALKFRSSAKFINQLINYLWGILIAVDIGAAHGQGFA